MQQNHKFSKPPVKEDISKSLPKSHKMIVLMDDYEEFGVLETKIQRYFESMRHHFMKNHGIS